MTFEYKHLELHYSPEKQMEILNEIGAEGWEMMAIRNRPSWADGWEYIFKRSSDVAARLLRQKLEAKELADARQRREESEKDLDLKVQSLVGRAAKCGQCQHQWTIEKDHGVQTINFGSFLSISTVCPKCFSGWVLSTRIHGDSPWEDTSILLTT